MSNEPEAMQRAVAAKQTQIGGDWFFWIAGFSIINSVMAFFGTQIRFVVGLGTTELIDAGNGGLSQGVTIALDVAAAALYGLFGVFARRGALWAFSVGAIFYVLDMLLLILVFKNWLAVAFHAYVLFRIFGGFQAAQRLSALRVRGSAASGAGSVPPRPSSSGDVWPPPPSA